MKYKEEFESLRANNNIDGLNDFFKKHGLKFSAMAGQRVPRFFKQYEFGGGYSIGIGTVRQHVEWVKYNESLKSKKAAKAEIKKTVTSIAIANYKAAATKRNEIVKDIMKILDVDFGNVEREDLLVIYALADKKTGINKCHAALVEAVKRN